jgi:lipoprotein NlpD
MIRIGIALCGLAVLAGCASTDVPAPIIDRSPSGTGSASGPSMPSAGPAPAPSTTASAAKAVEPPRPPLPARDFPPKPTASLDKPVGSPVAAPVGAPEPAPAVRAAAPASAPKEVEADAPAIRPYREGDWRPEYYAVKRGDTLYSIALDHGHDYRDLAAWNDLSDPAYIQVGQRLRLFPPGDSAVLATPEPVALPPATIAPAKVPAPPPVPTLTEPKARRMAYSEQALAELTQYGSAVHRRTPTTAAAPPSPPPAAAAPKPAASAPRSVQAGMSDLADERLTWEWPTNGRLLYGFGEGPNFKGIGIDGAIGQPVLASAPGRVVYSGSGLRGYGKLIIIKHNASYLSVYAHNSQLLVREGQTVAQGQKIAEMGDSDSDRVGLHFEIRRLGKPIDPLKYLPEKSS